MHSQGNAYNLKLLLVSACVPTYLFLLLVVILYSLAKFFTDQNKVILISITLTLPTPTYNFPAVILTTNL